MLTKKTRNKTDAKHIYIPSYNFAVVFLRRKRNEMTFQFLSCFSFIWSWFSWSEFLLLAFIIICYRVYYNLWQHFVVLLRFCIVSCSLFVVDVQALCECWWTQRHDKWKMDATITIAHSNFIDHCLWKLNKNHCFNYLKRIKVDFEMVIIVRISPNRFVAAHRYRNFVPREVLCSMKRDSFGISSFPKIMQ